ncbi:MAG: virB8 family protein [Candidatus Accumulibacter sp.]|jgi:type IV secretion system protein VirB8|nr:virB8 family protein [Accumulibacter sp.]
MNKVEKADFEKYLKEARTWETDKVREIEKSKRIAWRIASISILLAFASVLAVTGMMPLKTVEPYVIRVDNSTGIVDVVEALTDGKTNYEEAVNKYFTQWYVRYREGYSKELAEEYYFNVGIMSNTTEQQKYYQFFQPKNPLSPINIYGDYAKVKITIKSTSFINPTIALVRYTKAIERGLDRPVISHWAATITFHYTKAPMSEKDRAINPLGFQVFEYRNDPDALAPAATPVALAPPPVAASPVPLFLAPETPPAPPAVEQ